MSAAILSAGKALPGSIVECWCYKGGSTANLSLVAACCGRRLEVFDSCRGLPQPGDNDREHLLLDRREVHTYSACAYAGASLCS
jgi:O-methyltransferase